MNHPEDSRKQEQFRSFAEAATGLKAGDVIISESGMPLIASNASRDGKDNGMVILDDLGFVPENQESTAPVAASPSQPTDAQRLFDELVDGANAPPQEDPAAAAERHAQEAAFMPVAWLMNLFTAHKLERYMDWLLDCAPESDVPETPIEHRIFLVNRALRLNISELSGVDTVALRGMISDQVSLESWMKIIMLGVLPALKKLEPAKNVKREIPQVPAA